MAGGKRLSSADKIIYGSGNFAYGVTLQVMASYLVFFGTAILGLSGSLIGFLTAISVFWDAVSDPMMGYVSDTVSVGRLGKRHGYILAGGMLLAVFNGILWQIPVDWNGTVKAAILFASLIAVKTMMTVFATPYNALGAELTRDYDERTSVQTYRTVFFTLGLAFTTVIGMYVFFKPTAQYAVGQLNPFAYGKLGWTISGLVAAVTLLSVGGTLKFIPNLPKEPVRDGVFSWSRLFDDFKDAFRNLNYLSVAGGYLSGNLATAILGSVGLHVFTYTFALSNIGVGTVFAVIFGMTILSQGFWLKMSTRYDKKNAVLLAVLSALLGTFFFLVLVFIRDAVRVSFWWLMPYAFFSGVGMGGLITLPFSMIADTVDEEEYEVGIRSEGLYYGGLTFSYKISQSAAIFLMGIVLDLVGFDSAKSVQSEGTVLSLGLVVAVGSILSLMLAYHFYSSYSLTKTKVEATQEELKKRHQKKD